MGQQLWWFRSNVTVNSFMPHLRRFAALRVSFFVFADAADVIVYVVVVVVIAGSGLVGL